eukprot:1364319-Amphidinium_carterae.1
MHQPTKVMHDMDMLGLHAEWQTISDIAGEADRRSQEADPAAGSASQQRCVLDGASVRACVRACVRVRDKSLPQLYLP